MGKWLSRLRIGFGVVAILTSLGIAVRAAVSGAVPESGSALRGVAILLVLIAVGWALWRVGTSESAESATGPLVSPAPERTPADTALSGRALADAMTEAGERARAERSVAAGVDTIRPLLSRSLEDALVAGGADRMDARESIRAGTWTDDPVAGSVCSSTVSMPERSVRARLAGWLYPERELRRRVRRAVAAIDEAATETLPRVPGQDAPKRVRIVRPRLETLQRDVDGRLQPAADSPVPPGEDER
ncbi:DUF7269 family protein [Halorientalis regularis]|uniref:Uncharacterized protein n=1 Tax=Halorientalis regularis TaxID=660518 RepID=A0A1G7HRT2_9EURY|nr:hypothetical protein [Halorientalis regularis]SDF03036.1 hypothetical protein SAMN05216218_103132 [Halorientalis regularis]